MIRLRTAGIALATGSALALTAAGCSTTMTSAGPAYAPPGTKLVAVLRESDGTPAGTATAVATDGGGIRVSINAENLPAGAHGAHIHSVGSCIAPDFASAGGHWNPTGAHHGINNPQSPKPHAGDLPNLLIGADGRGELGVTLSGGAFADLVDADGSSVVIHSGPDDLMSDPSGNSGSRIACGVFKLVTR